MEKLSRLQGRSLTPVTLDEPTFHFRTKFGLGTSMTHLHVAVFPFINGRVTL